jgi:hypothetical protein
MRLAEADAPALRRLGGVRDQEQRIAIGLDLRPLVRVLRVLDGEVVQAEFLLQLVQQQVFGFVQADPDEAAILHRQHVADLVQGDVVATALAVVGHAVDHAAGQGEMAGRGVHAFILPPAEPEGKQWQGRGNPSMHGMHATPALHFAGGPVPLYGAWCQEPSRRQRSMPEHAGRQPRRRPHGGNP